MVPGPGADCTRGKDLRRQELENIQISFFLGHEKATLIAAPFRNFQTDFKIDLYRYIVIGFFDIRKNLI